MDSVYKNVALFLSLSSSGLSLPLWRTQCIEFTLIVLVFCLFLSFLCFVDVKRETNFPRRAKPWNVAFGDPIQFDPHYQSYHRVDDINTRSRSLVEAIIRCPRLMAGDDMACNEDRMQDTCEMPNADVQRCVSCTTYTIWRAWHTWTLYGYEYQTYLLVHVPVWFFSFPSLKQLVCLPCFSTVR